MFEKITPEALMDLAVRAMQSAYSPYSGFHVGAALLCDDETVYVGCNIENASFTPTVCAERVAFFKAISEGKRGFSAIAVAGAKRDSAGVLSIPGFTAPCGVCRQVMREFCTDDFKIVMTDGEKNLKIRTLGEIFPDSFSAQDMK